MKKKFWLILLTLLTALCLALGISACGGTNGGKNSVNGTYYRYESEQLDKSDWYELKNGKWKDSGGEQGTYKLSDGTILFYEEVFGENINWATGTVKDGVLSLSSLGMTLTYCKEGSVPSSGSQPGGTTPGGEQGDTPSVQEYEVTFILNYTGGGSVKKSTQDGLVTYVPERANYVFNGWWLIDGQTESGDYILAQKWDTSEKVTEEGLVLVAEWVEESTVSAQLPAPSVSIDGEVFSWQEIPGAESYDVRVYKSGLESEEMRKTISGTSWTFPSSYDAGYYTVKIRAIGDGETTVNSAYVSKSYGHRILSAVTNISFDISTSILTWTAVRNATSYDLSIDGQEVETLTYTTYDLSDFEAGSHMVTIVAKRDGYQSSSANEIIEKKRLKTPKMTVTLNENRIQYTVSWESVLHADTYIVTLNGKEHRVTDANSYAFDRTSEDWGDAETIVVTVTAFDSNRDYLISNPSQEETVERAYAVILTVSDKNAGSVAFEGATATKLPCDVGEEVSFTALATTDRLGYIFVGWYQGEEEISTELSFQHTITMGKKNVSYEARWSVDPAMADFRFTSTLITCTITGVKDKTKDEYIIPDYVTSIGRDVFRGCSAIQSITIPFVGGSRKTSTDTYQYPFGYIFGTSQFSGASKTTQRYHGSSTNKTTSTDYYIPDSLKSVTVTGGEILYGAFYGCSELESVTIGSGVTSIGSSAFSGCSSIQSITIPFVGGSRKTSTDTYQYPFGYIFGTSQFSGASETTQSYYGSSTNNIISTDYYIPDSLKSVTVTGGEILYGAFYGCSELESVTIGSGVTSIGSSAFDSCSGLTGELKIPDGVTSIGGSAFRGCSGLTGELKIPDGVTSIGGSAFRGCSGLTGELKIPDSVTSIGKYAFEGTAYYNDDSNWDESGVLYIGNYLIEAQETISGSYEIRANTKVIGDGAFYNCSGLTGELKIPDGVTSIGDEAFYKCSGLTGELKIPDSVTSIGDSAFRGCSGLESVTLGSGVTSIGSGAFWYCIGLKAVYYKGTAEEWKNISINNTDSYNSSILNVTRYYFTEDAPAAEEWASYEYWWHYDPATSLPTPWVKDQ